MKNNSSSKLPVAVVGARGYSGLDLARILLKHPSTELKICFAGESAFRLSDYLPETASHSVDVKPISELPQNLKGLAAVFLATPAEVSLELAPKILEAGVDVIDLSGAFRLQSGTNADRKDAYQTWYKMDHSSASLLDEAQYGLVPFASRSKSGRGRLIANPGCYATSVLVALVPLLKAGIIDPNSLVIDSKSGTSGGGRKPAENLLFTEVDGECLPYKVGKHQHLPEITEHAKALSGVSIDPHFVTHLLPVRRGIISGIYAKLNSLSGKAALAAVKSAYQSAFEGYPLVRFGEIGESLPPPFGMSSQIALSLKRVSGTARTHIQYQVVDQKLYVFSLIDNLMKGAASQAVENFNRLNALPVDLGLADLEGTL